MFDLGEIGATLTLDDQDFKKKLDGLNSTAEGSFSKIGNAVKTLAATAAGYFAFSQVKSFAVDAVKIFAEAGEAAQKFEVVFSSLMGDGPAGELGKAAAAAREMQENYGMSEFAAKSALSMTGDLLTGFGFTQDKALELSITAAKLGADLASFANYAGGAEGAINALTKGMLGETEMMKQLGIVVRQTDKEYMDLVKSIMEKKGVTLNEAKAEATLITAVKQSKNAIGDYARTSGSLSNQMRLTGERMTDLKMKVGGFLVSVFNLEEGSQTLNQRLLQITDFIAANSAEWVYYVKTAGNAIYTGLAGAWQVLMPVFGAGFEIIGQGFRNIWELGKWAFENLGAIFGDFGNIIAAVFQDSITNAKTFFSLLLESASTVGSSLWGLLTGKLSFEDVKEKFSGLADSALTMIGTATSNTEEALRAAGVGEMPDFEFPDFDKIISGFSDLPEKIEQENLAGLERQARIDEEYMKSKLGLDKEELPQGAIKSVADEAKEQIEKGSDSTGSFSAAIVSAMLGRGRPEEETARNTKEMRLMLQRIEKKPLMTF